MEYHHWWSARQNAAHFGQRICDAWASEYLLSAGADPEDLVVVDPGNGFNYLFDLAGALRGELCLRPRVSLGYGASHSLAQTAGTRAGCVGTPGPDAPQTTADTSSPAPPGAGTTSTSSQWTPPSIAVGQSREHDF